MNRLTYVLITFLLVMPSVSVRASSIGQVAPAQVLSNGVTTANIWAQDIVSDAGIFTIKSTILSPNSSSSVSVVLLENQIEGRFEANYSGFILSGSYVINIVIENEDGTTSDSLSTTVSQLEEVDPDGPDYFEDDDVAATASLLIVSDISAQRHTFHDLGDVDYVQFTARGNNRVFEIELNTLTINDQPNLSDPVLTLMSVDFVLDAVSGAETAVETVIARIDNGFAGEREVFSFTPDKDGLYFIKVENLKSAIGATTSYELKVFESIAGFPGPDLKLTQSVSSQNLSMGAGLIVTLDIINLGALNDIQTATGVESQTFLRGGLELNGDLPTNCLLSNSIVVCQFGDIEKEGTAKIELPFKVSRAGEQRILSAVQAFAADGRKMPDAEFRNNSFELTLLVAPIVDTDSDGIPDDAELLVLLDPNDASDALGDLDVDGITNLDEYLAGTLTALTVNSAPTIVLVGNANITLRQGDAFIDEGATANDNEDGNLTTQITLSGDTTLDTNILGEYKLIYSVADSNGLITSVSRMITVGPRARLKNLATRGFVGTGDDVLIGGLVITGTQAKTVIIRAKGPSLAAFGVANTLDDPMLTLVSGATVIDTNDNWQDHPNVGLIPDELKPTDDKEAVIAISLNPGAYTAIVTGVAAGSGIGIFEVFELDDTGNSRLVNIATRGLVGTGDNVLIAGIVIDGTANKKLVIRAKGPSLAAFGVPGVLSNPQLVLFSGPNVIVGNDNWQSHESLNNVPIELRPTDDFESVIYAELAPGAYTAILSGFDGETGVGIVEVFEIQ